MNKILFYIFFFIIITNCTLKKVEKHHGFHYLDKKQEKLNINISNKNDILSILGPPSTKGSFDNDLWIYIEQKEAKQSLFRLGRTKIEVNNILVLEIDNMGLLVEKTFLDKESMNRIKFSEDATVVAYKKSNFVYNFLSSLRQKVNDPLGKRKEAGSRRKNKN
tara:strand:- start:208 stop:696 length:489 start_codon:yes stop_codon:yes gene_type:complete